jgi:spore coat polysaccharide biosynthesis protein SpsF
MNPQEELWAGKFGDEYQRRSPGDVEANRVLFEHVLRRLSIRSVIEFGAGVGNNLLALRELLPEVALAAIEINLLAAEEIRLKRLAVDIFVGSALTLNPWANPGRSTWDLVLTKGFLIHIPPDDLPMVYEKMHQASQRYIMVAEYYNPKPVAIPYRGQEQALWKRDFAGELLDRYTDLCLIDYGFVYHRDPHPQDDLTWFLMEKR